MEGCRADCSSGLTCTSLICSQLFGDDIASVWNYKNSVDQYSAVGGTALSSVRQQVANMKTWLAANLDSAKG